MCNRFEDIGGKVVILRTQPAISAQSGFKASY
jgi:hypothetical protein